MELEIKAAIKWGDDCFQLKQEIETTIKLVETYVMVRPNEGVVFY